MTARGLASARAGARQARLATTAALLAALVAGLASPAADDRTPGPDYRHHASGEDNGDAHLKNLLIGHEVVVPVTRGQLDLGPWQQIFYYEFDGRRKKRLILKALGV